MWVNITQKITILIQSYQQKEFTFSKLILKISLFLSISLLM